MMTEKYELENYKKFLLNRVTASSGIVESIENCLQNDDRAAKHYFHKIMIHNWQDTLHELFDRLSGYFGTVIVPVKCSTQGDIATFYTSNLSLVSKIVKFDFMFPYNRNMFSIDILFNDKSSTEFFGSVTTIDEIVSGIVSRRFGDKCELDLSNFCDDPEFTNNKIYFYKISLLANFKILMLRMGRDTKMLNLSNNNLSQVPLDVLNFFIKADLTAMNFSNNNIPAVAELSRVSSKIEKLWLEGNPLCEDLDPVSYVKTVTVKFPRLTELDGVKLNQHGIVFPFYRNYLCQADRKTKMVVEKFVTLYFSNYDQPSKRRRKRIEPLYDTNAIFTLSSDFLETQTTVSHYRMYSRNALNPSKQQQLSATAKTYTGGKTIANILSSLPESVHDRSTFTVDVLVHDKKSLHLTIDGLFKEKISGLLFQFRRTFIFSIYTIRDSSVYHIMNDMFNLTYANEDQMKYGFQNPVRNMNSLVLIAPTPDESQAIIKAFQHITQLRTTEVELKSSHMLHDLSTVSLKVDRSETKVVTERIRKAVEIGGQEIIHYVDEYIYSGQRLKYHSWDIREALKSFLADARANKMSTELFMDSDFSDSSSLLDEIEY